MIRQLRWLVVPFVAVTLAIGQSSPVSAQAQLGPDGPFTEPKPGAPPRPGPNGPFATFAITMPTGPMESLPADALWPRVGQLTPGNSVPYWYRALEGLDRGWQSQAQAEPFRKAFGGGTETPWMDMPIAELPKEEVRAFLAQFSRNLENARTAALREETEWSLRMRDLRGLPAIEYLLSEFQQMRSLGRLLKLRIHLALADGDFRAAAEWSRVGFRLSKAMDSDECLIVDLVGIACGSIIQNELGELISLPDSPNLYWALAGVPEPIVNCRDSLDTELTLPERIFPWFADAEEHPRTSTGWRDDFRRTLREGRQLTNDSRRYAEPGAPDWEVDLRLVQALFNGYPGAVRDLAADGIPAAEVEAMPVGQVVAVHQQRFLRKMSDEVLKVARRADPALVVRVEEALQQFRRMAYCNAEGFSPATFLADDLVPSVAQGLKVEWRQVVKHRALLVVEAIRLHAAEHQGQLPGSLDEITVVPVPRHPVTGQHFPYSFKDSGAVLDAPTGFPREPYILMRFELKPGR